MISSFRHKGLRRFYETDDASGIHAGHAERLRRVLSLLDQIHTDAAGSEFAGAALACPKGELRGFWSIKIGVASSKGNLRTLAAIIIFIFNDLEWLDIAL